MKKISRRSFVKAAGSAAVLSLLAACGSTANTPPAEEPAKTGDAGIALYAGLSLLALSGSGWAVGKKRRGEK